MKTLALIPLLLLTACLRTPTLSPSEAESVATAAQSLLAQTPASTVPSESWPMVISTLSPKSVRVASEGVYIEMSSRFSEEAGFFVPRNPGAFNPVSGGDPEYERINGIVFAYYTRG